MRALIVSVDYTSELSLCLPWNRHHFDEVLLVTSPADLPNVAPIAAACQAEVFATDLFYRGGARFNKFAALEAGLDHFGRQGWLCLMDADVLWPQRLPQFERRVGYLYAPLRRMYPTIPHEVPPEETWYRYPIHRNVAEWAGYSQIFHADDEHLGQPPWHDVRLLHAGTGDSLFQFRWPPACKIRLPFQVLHVGEAGANWLGRITPRPDGSIPEGADERRAALREMIRQRKPGPGRFDHERIRPEW